ncbi:MAG TPA: hypothetical protein ENG51_16325 [Deltaproteobacteria bacterium]|nr:MAG: hypothetical protein DRG83_06350 [Deltaproteobacteria bacterium]HDM78008.1 hypothetical protein [Deltaproteobacteria bacterium]
MKVGIGYCNEEDVFLSGMKAARGALEEAGTRNPVLAFAFCSGGLDAEVFFKGLQSTLGENIPIVGGSAIGIITNSNISYKGYPAAVAVIDDPSLRAECFSVGNLDADERAAGRKLSRKLNSTRLGKLIFLLYDSLKTHATADSPPILNSSARLLQGISEELKKHLPILGAGLIGDYTFSPTKQFCGFFTGEQTIIALVLDGHFTCYHRIMHGCSPLDGVYHIITKVKDDVIFEIDGKPAADVIDELYGNPGWRNEHPVKLLTIGINCKDKFGEFHEGNYVNRLITGVMPDGKSIGIFEPDLEEGIEFQFMLRDGQMMIESARKNSKRLVEELKSREKTPLFALYIDCAGRTAEFSQTLTEEAAEVQKTCNEHGVPLLGFYSGVEIAPLLGRSRGLDWTGVLIIWAR